MTLLIKIIVEYNNVEDHMLRKWVVVVKSYKVHYKLWRARARFGGEVDLLARILGDGSCQRPGHCRGARGQRVEELKVYAAKRQSWVRAKGMASSKIRVRRSRLGKFMEIFN
jgi:hypothetical protein